MSTEINQAPRSVVVIGGSGESGRRIVRDLRLHHSALRVVSASRHRDGEAELPAGVTWCELDIERPDEARDRLRAFDLAIIALGPMEHVGARAHSLCLEAGVDCVDINDSLAAGDAILALEQQAAANGCRIYTGLGLSPGLSTLLLLQLAHGNASAAGLYRSRLYMGAAHGGGKTSPHALVASFRKQLEIYRDGRRQRIASPWRDVASRFRFPGHDRPLALIPYATPETATLARNGAEVGITGLDSRFHVQFLPQGLARTIAAIAPGPALREAVARRFHASGQAAKRRRSADPATTLWVYPDDRPQDGLAVHGPLSAYDLTSAMVCAVIDGIVAGWLQTPPGVWSLDGHTTPDQVRRLGDALRRRGVLIRPASFAEHDAERFRFGWCQTTGESVRTLRHYRQSWYSAAVPLPPALRRLQQTYLLQSDLWTTLRSELGVTGLAALLPRIAKRWFGLRQSTALYRRRQPPWPTIARDFSLFAAGYGEIRRVLGQKRALALYRRMFLDSARMEMRWLWPDPELFTLLPDPVAAAQDYWSAYLDDCEALGVLEVRRDGDTFQLHNCAYAILFHLLGCPELSGLVREMEREALSGLARAAGLDLEWHTGEDGTAEISLRPLRPPPGGRGSRGFAEHRSVPGKRVGCAKPTHRRVSDKGSPVNQHEALIDGGLQQTAWLTAGCHVSAGAAWALHRPVSAWLIDRFGMPPFAERLKYFTVHGIAQRAAAIDRMLDARLSEWEANGDTYEVWSLGAGFDSRWYGLSGRTGLRRYLEFDLPELLARKRALLDTSPYAPEYARVIAMPGEVQETVAGAAPEEGNRLMVVIEGMIDYLDTEEKRRLLADLTAKPGGCEIIVDVQNAHLTRHNNRRAERATGTSTVHFALAPNDPERFYTATTGFQLHAAEALLPGLFRARFPRLGLLLPLPKRVRRSYLLLHLVPTR